MSKTLDDELLNHKQSEDAKIVQVEMFHCTDNFNFYEEDYLVKKKRLSEEGVLPYKFEQFGDNTHLPGSELFADILKEIRTFTTNNNQ